MILCHFRREPETLPVAFVAFPPFNGVSDPELAERNFDLDQLDLSVC